METTVKAIRTFVNDKLDHILTAYKFADELGAFLNEYFYEHTDELENVYTVFKCSNPSISVIIEGEKIPYIKNGEKFFNDQKQSFEAIVKKRLQSGEDEICSE